MTAELPMQTPAPTDELYRDWNRAEKKTTASGQCGSVARTEILWRNFC